MTDVWLARHGATAWSAADLMCGSSDIELAPEGQVQAVLLAQRLAGEKLDAIYTSPLLRAVETAAPIAAQHQIMPVTVADLREMDFGSWEGQPRDAIIRDDGERYRAWQHNPDVVCPTNGEGAYTVVERAARALADIVERHPEQTVLLVAHRTVNRILLCHLLGLPIRLYRDRIAQGICALNRFRVDHEGQVQITLMNDVAHVQRGG
ncbi:MAG: Alpha-ribazole-5'-phosphate phosphatase [uncultured Chloroflexia bacterium]|uniref:Alpha-ribazole-5'-phosphate phosphatase n=1 Tax=uncultured Chloroflexia bacterium TaxID=1672391 RepID=A0A6J4K8T3_9CHLR|nr:MAG: Alpha-ribazole-5'-phosphate phosphatase [uncultured Chloroflexia bacterium]